MKLLKQRNFEILKQRNIDIMIKKGQDKVAFFEAHGTSDFSTHATLTTTI